MTCEKCGHTNKPEFKCRGCEHNKGLECDKYDKTFGNGYEMQSFANIQCKL